jgi:hypothetical protein
LAVEEGRGEDFGLPQGGPDGGEGEVLGCFGGEEEVGGGGEGERCLEGLGRGLGEGEGRGGRTSRTEMLGSCLSAMVMVSCSIL